MVVLEREHVLESPSFPFSRSGVRPKIGIFNTFSNNDVGVGLDAENRWPVPLLLPSSD